MKIIEHVHMEADKIIASNILNNTREVLVNISFEIRRNCATELRKLILNGLAKKGWSNPIQINTRRKITITAVNGKVGLCLQTGNMARFYADLLKLQAQYLEGHIDGAIYILPTKACSKKMGSNLVYFERLTAELSKVFSSVITIPLVIIGFGSQEE